MMTDTPSVHWRRSSAKDDNQDEPVGMRSGILPIGSSLAGCS